MNALRGSLVLASLLSLLLPVLAVPEEPKAAPPDATPSLFDDIRAETLTNGLRVYLKPVPNSPIVTTMVAYKVGSCDEDKTCTGLSHYLEHLMFKGTHKLKPGDIDRLTQRSGGQNNAYTTDDFTAYHFDFAADRWETALDIEADRMRNLVIDEKHEFDKEKGAVIEELAAGEDEPWELEHKAILPMLFGKESPYGHPVIGEREHVRAATKEIIKAHYDKWYHPNNAVLVVVGGFDPDQAMARIKEKLGPIPAGTLPPRKAWPETNLLRPGRLEIRSKFEVARLLMGFNTVRCDHEDTYALDVIDTLLSDGKTSRFYRKLVVEEQLVNSVGTGSSAGRYAGWFGIQAELLPDKGDAKNRARLEEILLAELKRLCDEPVPTPELERARQKFLASTIFTRESVHSLADTIASGVILNDLDWLKQQLPRTLAVSPADIQRVARKYFDPQKRVAVWSVPEKMGEKHQGTEPKADTVEGGERTGPQCVKQSSAPPPTPPCEGGEWTGGYYDGRCLATPPTPPTPPCKGGELQREPALQEYSATPFSKVGEQETQPVSPESTCPFCNSPPLQGGVGGVARHRPNQSLFIRNRNQRTSPDSLGGSHSDISLQQAQRHVLPNGLTVLLLQNRRLPIVVAEARVKHVRLYEGTAGPAGLASLMGNLLDEGTTTRTGPQIAEQIENLGGVLSMDSGGGTLKVLAQDRTAGLELLFDCLRNPTFPAEAFAREQKRRLADLAELEEQADHKASCEFMAQVYGSHPYGKPSLGTAASVRTITREQCQTLHRRAFTTGNTTLILVGDFDAKEMLAELERLTAAWPREAAAPIGAQNPEMSTSSKRTSLSVPDAAQLQFYMGHLGIRRDEPDYFKLLVMDYVLGTGSGFTDRLSSRLRDREGLAYTVSANITSSAGTVPGTFTCYIGTEAKNLERVQQLFLEEIERLRKEKPSAQEVADVQRFLLGRLAFQLVSNEQIADMLHTVEYYQLGFDYLEKYRRAVQAVTPEDVRQVAQKHLHPDKLIIVAAGAVDKDGKPLK